MQLVNNVATIPPPPPAPPTPAPRRGRNLQKPHGLLSTCLQKQLSAQCLARQHLKSVYPGKGAGQESCCFPERFGTLSKSVHLETNEGTRWEVSNARTGERAARQSGSAGRQMKAHTGRQVHACAQANAYTGEHAARRSGSTWPVLFQRSKNPTVNCLGNKKLFGERYHFANHKTESRMNSK